MKLKNLLIGVIVVAILIGAKFIFFPNKPGQAANSGKGGAASPLNNVTAYVIKTENISNDITASGTIRANEDVQLQPELSGKITQINFKEGSKVNKGELLVKINDADLQASYKKLELQQKLADQKIQRLKQLLAINGVSQEEYDMAQSDYNTIKADIDFASAQILKTEIKAPFNGVIGLKNVSEGAFITPATVIASIQQIDPVKIDFSVPERYSSFLKKNGKVVFTIEGIKKEQQGEIFAIEPKIDLTTRTVQVRAICPNSNNDIYPGAFAQVKIELRTIDNAMMIPTEAIIPDVKGEKVFILKNGKTDYARVETGLRTESKIQITNGLKVGDTILTTGIMQLKPNVGVKITDLK
jgi:membrane fusion protein (multidrug efflux system)